MKTTTQRHLHLPLPDPLYRRLRDEARRLKRPATSVAREAVDSWLRDREQNAMAEAMAEYAGKWGGTEVDLDPELEATSIEHLAPRGRRRR